MPVEPSVELKELAAKQRERLELEARIQDLQNQITALEARVAALE